MSDDRARARRMMRLSELHARARQWQEDPTQDDAAAEFERTGRLPEEPVAQQSSGATSAILTPREVQRRRSAMYMRDYGKFRHDFYDVNIAAGISPISKEWKPVPWLTGLIGLGSLCLYILIPAAPWWWDVLPAAMVLWGLAGFVAILSEPWMRIDLYHRVNQNRRFLAQLAIRMCLMVPITYVGGGLVRYIYNAAGLIDFSARLFISLVASSVVAIILFSLPPLFNEERIEATVWDRIIVGSAFGGGFFLVAAIFFPLIDHGVSTIFAGLDQRSAPTAAIGLLYVLIAFAIGFGAYNFMEYCTSDRPSIKLPSIRFPRFAKDWLQRPRGESKLPSQPPAQPQPQFSFQPERVIDVKRQRRIPNFIFSTSRRHAALIRCGRCAGAVALIFLLAIQFNIIRDDASVPKGMEAYYYAAIAGMIVFAIGFLMFWRASKGRFDGGLTGRAVGEVLIAAALFAAGGQIVPYQPMAGEVVQFIAIFMAVAGSAKFMRLPWSFWKR